MADTQIMPQPINTSTKKRKRLTTDSRNKLSSKRASLNHNHDDSLNGTSSTFSPAEFVHQLQNATHDVGSSMGNAAGVALDTNSLSSDPHGLSFASNGTGPDPNQQLNSFDLSDPSTQPSQSSPYTLPPGFKPQDTPAPNSSGRDSASGTLNKPLVGTDEWHKLRRDNHKEGSQHSPSASTLTLDILIIYLVERRRREAINEGINALATIVPNCEKNKGSILQKAVTYINELRAQVTNNGERKQMEKAVLDQAVRELTIVNGDLQGQLRGLLEENDRLKKKVRDLGGDGALENLE